LDKIYQMIANVEVKIVFSSKTKRRAKKMRLTILSFVDKYQVTNSYWSTRPNKPCSLQNTQRVVFFVQKQDNKTSSNERKNTVTYNKLFYDVSIIKV
jgi:hypothetical protein